MHGRRELRLEKATMGWPYFLNIPTFTCHGEKLFVLSFTNIVLDPTLTSLLIGLESDPDWLAYSESASGIIAFE